MASRAAEPASQPSVRRFVWQCAVIAGLALAAVWAAFRTGRDADPSTTRLVRFTSGQRLVYQIDFESASASDFGAIFSQGQSSLSHVFEAGIQGELVVTVLKADNEQTSIVYQLHPAAVHLQADGQDEPSQSATIQRDLAQPVFGLLEGRGKVESVRFDLQTGSVAQHLVRTLLAASQVVGPATGNVAPGAEWDTDEEDPSGKLVAHYHVLADGTVHKSKLRYLQLQQPKKRRTILLTPTIQSKGEYVATLDADRRLTAIHADDAQSVTLQNKLVGHGTLKLDMRLLRTEEAAPAELAALRAANAERRNTTRAVTLYVATTPEDGQLAIQRQELGSATLADLLADLATAEKATVEKATPNEKDTTRLFLKFKALAIVRPESCAKFGELLIRAEPGRLTMHTLTDALEATGNAEAQAALSAAIEGRAGDWPALAILIPALGAAESPTPQTEQTLGALAFGTPIPNVTSTARLALGNVARSLREDSPARSAKIVDRILLELANPAAVNSRWQLLLAVGNSGSLEALPTLTQFLDESAPDLRGAAAWAMRWIDSPEVDRLLTSKILRGDKDRAVRLEAVRALRFREKTPSNFKAQKQALATESEPDVRTALLGNLWDARDSNPEAQGLVENAAANDPDSSVRKAAAKFLHPGSTAP